MHEKKHFSFYYLVHSIYLHKFLSRLIILLAHDYWDGFPVNGLIISNGFVSRRNSTLFEKNNRAHQIQISSGDGNFSFVYELDDISDLQVLKLPAYASEITIKSVYPVFNRVAGGF